ncbi:unnamed protein product, partial [Closterium sp. NIES-53]
LAAAAGGELGQAARVDRRMALLRRIEASAVATRADVGQLIDYYRSFANSVGEEG